jgi:hypothetical protein
MTPFANATTPARAALGTALGLAACALFLLVASNVLLLGLRLHDGGFHWSEIATSWPRYGADPRFDRWLTLSTLAGVVVVFGLLGAILRHRPLPLHGNARFASEREIKTAGLRSKEGLLLGRKDGAMLCFGGSEHVLRTPQPAPGRASAMSFQTCSIGRIPSLRWTSRKRTGIAPPAFAPPTGRRFICSIRSTRTVAPRATIHWAMCAAILPTFMTICSASR